MFFTCHKDNQVRKKNAFEYYDPEKVPSLILHFFFFFFFIFPTSVQFFYLKTYSLLGHNAGKYVDSLNHEDESIKKLGILDLFVHLLFFAANTPPGTDAIILSLEVGLP